MSNAKYIGRVGGLAVALGVGIAVASTPAVAWADNNGSADSQGSTGTTGAAGRRGASESRGISTTTGTKAEPAGTSTVAGSHRKGAPASGSGSVDASQSGTSRSAGASVRQLPGTTMSTGGVDSSTKSHRKISAIGDVAAASTTDDSTLPVGGPRGRSNRRQQRGDDLTGVPGVDAHTLTAWRTAAPTRPEVLPPPRNVVGVAVREPGARQPLTAVTANTDLPPRANVVAQAISAARTEPPSTVSAVVLAALATVGLGPLAANGPLTPVDSPLELALLSVGARPRPFGQPVGEATKTLAGSPTLTSLAIDSVATADQQTLAVVAAVNSAPNVPSQPIGTPDPVTGVVIATDADNDTLTYTVAGAPTNGTVALNSQTGAYTYAPTTAARLAAGATAVADTDTFTVAVSDGQQATTAAVSVYVSPTHFDNQAPIAVGASPSGVVVGSDGRMYVANTGSRTVSVINTATGQHIDANPSIFSTDIKVGSSPAALALTPDGKRLYVANTGSNTVSVIDTGTYKMIDTNTSAFGIQSISVGSSPSALAYGADGRLYVANRGSGTVSVINTATNTLVDTNPNASGLQSISVGSSPSALALSGTQLYVANAGSNTVSVINTSSYSLTNTITVGSQPASVALGADGRLYVANNASNTVSVIDTATNTLVDTNPNALGTNPISVGSSPSSVALSPDGGLAYVANGNDTVSVIDTKNYTVLSTVAIDTDTTGGHVIAVSPNGTIYVTDAADRTVRVLTIAESTGVSAIGNVTITGDRPGSLVLSADGTRAVLITAYPIGRVTSASYPDGIRGSTTRVAVIDTASGSQVGTTFTVTGPRAAGVQLSADGTRALITSSAYDATGTRVAVLNTTTGTQVGTTFTLTGGGSAQFIANDSRALITTTAYSQSTNTTTTRVAVLNTTTGTQAGATLALAGNGSAALSPDGAHALIITEANVAAINTVTGTATTAALTGSWGLERWSADGSRALISSRVTDAAGTTTRVAVIDTTTGAQTGTTLTVTGNGSVQSGPDGTRALITTKVTSAGSTTTRIAAFNTTIGTQIGTTLVLTGDGSVQTNADGSRALITSDVYDSATASHSTQLTVFNTATGAQTGTTLTLTGGLLYGVQPKFSPDGTRALITTDVYDSTTTLRNSRVTTIDTTTGTKIGTTLTLNGPEPVETTWRADGIRALVTMTPTQYDSVISPMLVAMLDTTTGTQVGTTLSLTGMPTYGVQPVVTPDGNHALITTNDYSPATGTTVRVTTVDTTTGTQIGTTITLTAAASGRTVLSPNANRAIITAGDQVAIINTTTGTQVGTTVAINGTPSAVLFSGGTRAVITTAASVTVIDTSTGTQTGTTFTLTAPRPIETTLTADGTHALVTTGYRHFFDPAIPATPIALIDLTTGTQIGTTLTLIGDTYASPAFTLNGTRTLIATVVDDPTNGVSTTRVTTINTATGMPTGTTVTLSGALASGVNNPLRVVLSPDGARALIATTSAPGGTRTSQVAVINAATGTQIGNTVTINGALSGLRWSTDGTRVFVTTYITTATGADLSIQETVLKTL